MVSTGQMWVLTRTASRSHVVKSIQVHMTHNCITQSHSQSQSTVTVTVTVYSHSLQSQSQSQSTVTVYSHSHSHSLLIRPHKKVYLLHHPPPPHHRGRVNDRCRKIIESSLVQHRCGSGENMILKAYSRAL